MLLFRAAIAFRSALLECFNKIFRKVAYDKLCHRRVPSRQVRKF